MLEKIEITNFQKHKRLSVSFDPTVTTIVGRSEKGKSAIIRALQFVMLNEWNGDTDRRHGSSITKVKLLVDGHVLVRKKGSANLYRLDASKYKAFAKNVPEEIQKLLNVGPVNFQEQFEPHFWLSKAAGQVSQELNSIINLEIIDDSLSNISSELRKAKLAVDISRNRLKSYKEEKQSLSWVPDLVSAQRHLEVKAKRLKESRKEIERLTFLCKEVVKYQGTQGTWEQCVKDGQRLLSDMTRLEDENKRLAWLRGLVTGTRKAQVLTNLPIPKIPVTNQPRIDRLKALIQEIKETQWLVNQKCPLCERTL